MTKAKKKTRAIDHGKPERRNSPLSQRALVGTAHRGPGQRAARFDAQPVIVFNVGWMKEYEGNDTISGGGSYVEKHGKGGEAFNFLPHRGKFYGYVRAPRGGRSLDITKLGASDDLDRVYPVTVAWTATRPSGRAVLVGWYESATVYRERQSFPSGRERAGYFATTAEEHGVLLKESERQLRIPRNRPGAMGQSNV